MVARVLVIGGYGNFGAYIAQRLVADENIQVVIGGRNEAKARAFIAKVEHAKNSIEYRQLDVFEGLRGTLEAIRPDIVVHTSGPFQNQGYEVASTCIELGCHYIDIADARSFVAGFSSLDNAAKKKGVVAISGASSVPCLTAAIIDEYLGRFKKLNTVEYGIATAQQTNRGLATTSAVLSYAGKPFTTLIDGQMTSVIGWQDLHSRFLPGVGSRLFGNCDVPDLEIFPSRYPDIQTIRFYAGLEVPIVHIGLWLLTWLVRWHLLSTAEVLAPSLLRTSRLFDGLGSDVSGFFMELTGMDETGIEKTVRFDLKAGSGDGPFIPCAPAIILAKRLSRQEISLSGACPCVGLVDLSSYLAELDELDIHWSETESSSSFESGKPA